MRTRRSGSGQAAIEFAIGIFVFALVLTALVGFAPLFLRNFELQSEARCDAGVTALGAEEGSDGLGGVAAITARAQPLREPGGEDSDPWDYPVERMPDEPLFSEWRGNSIDAGRLIPGGRKKEFRFKMSVGGRMLVDDSGWLSEEIRMPPMGGGDR